MVEEANYVSGHDVDRVCRLVMGLVAVAVATAVEADDLQARIGQRLLPSRADPVEPVVGREAMHQHDRGSVLRAVDLVMQTYAIAVEIHRLAD